MNLITRFAIATAAIAACAIAGGCKADNKPAAAPASSDAATAQDSAAMLGATDAITAAANDAVVNAGSSQNVNTAADGASGAGPAASNFSFQNSGNVTVDLDAVDGSGHDKFPNATGTFKVTWSGTVVLSQPLNSGGNAGYTVTVDYLTDCAFTDPTSGAIATIAAGGSRTYALELDWMRTDANNWSISATSDITGSNLAGSVSKNGNTLTTTLDGTRHGHDVLAYTGGVLSFTRTVTADWTLHLTYNAGPLHTVVWHRPALNQIYVTVDGTQYGPYTAAQVALYFHCKFN